jgi:mannose-6-phosphate isomerase-like protein (cupin superfamily)
MWDAHLPFLALRSSSIPPVETGGMSGVEASYTPPMSFETRRIEDAPLVIAPDGSDVRVLPQLERGSMIYVELAAGRTSVAIAHRSVEELWYVISGRGEMWRHKDDDEAVVTLEAGVSITIPVGTSFQFRSLGPGPLRAICVTMPPWPGMDEAYEVDGPWEATTG